MSSLNDRVKVLDCTFRDGGYYTNWDFEYSLVQQYVSAINRSGISHVEVGFRNFPDKQYRGAFYYSHDDYVKSLGFSSSISLYVMVDASSFSSVPDIKSSVEKLFQKSNKSPISGVRIASRLDELEISLQLIEFVKELGYTVCLNIMQVATISAEDLQNAIAKIEVSSIEALYFADSLGEMDPIAVQKVAEVISQKWCGEIGIHAHNNRGLALANSLAAVEFGVTWLDATMSGMGRGAGNAEIEGLLLEMPDLIGNPKPLFSLVLSQFEPMQREFGWGASFLYALAARNAIHPTFMQEMLSRAEYPTTRILEIVEYLSTVNARKYDERLLTFSAGSGLNFPGSWNATSWCIDREVLIIGGGGSVNEHKYGLFFYITNYKPLVISLSGEKSDLIDGYVDVCVCANEAKMIAEGDNYPELEKPIIIPKGMFERVSDIDLSNCDVRDYGVKVEENVFEPGVDGCVLPSESSLAFALALASIGRAKTISLVGFDGYSDDDIRSISMNSLFSVYQDKERPTLISLTPTKYNIPEGSLYSI